MYDQNDLGQIKILYAYKLYYLNTIVKVYNINIYNTIIKSLKILHDRLKQ